MIHRLSPTRFCSVTTGLATVAAAKPSKGREWKVRRCPHCRAQFGYDSKVQPQLLAQEGLSSHTLPVIPAKTLWLSFPTQLLLRLEYAQVQDLGPSAFLFVYEGAKIYLSHFQSSSHPVRA